MKTILITGASSGIGEATARKLGREGHTLILCGRRHHKLDTLSRELESTTKVHTLVFDVRHRDSVLEAIGNIPPEFADVDVLINNAGNAHGLDPIDRGNWEDWEAMIDINVKGLLYVTSAVLPGMIARGSGHIIHIGSTAGKEVYPNGNVYCASKHAVDALNQGMRMDLYTKGIKVGALNPGLVETEFSKVRFKGDEERAAAVYKGFKPLKPEDIAEILSFMISRPFHVNVTDLVVMPSAQAGSMLVDRKPTD